MHPRTCMWGAPCDLCTNHPTASLPGAQPHVVRGRPSPRLRALGHPSPDHISPPSPSPIPRTLHPSAPHHPPPPFGWTTVAPPLGGGVGDRHLLNPKFFVAAHCVVVAQPPPKSAAQSIPVESGEHVQEFKVKWSRNKKIYTELVKE